MALGLSAVILLSGYELFEALKSAGDIQSADLAAAIQVAHGLDTMRADLLHAVPRANSQEPIFTGNDPNSAPQENTVKLLEFFSLCSGSGDHRSSPLRQMYHVTYELVKSQESASLYRRAVTVVGPPPAPAERRVLVLEHVERLQLVFRSGSSSAPLFSSNEKLPACVDLTVTAYGRTWPLAVKLPGGASEGQP